RIFIADTLLTGRNRQPLHCGGLARSDLSVSMLGLDGVESLATHQRQWGLPIDGDVMERVGQYLGGPGQAPRRAAQEEQVHGACDHGADAERQPDQTDNVREALEAGTRFYQIEQARSDA